MQRQRQNSRTVGVKRKIENSSAKFCCREVNSIAAAAKFVAAKYLFAVGIGLGGEDKEKKIKY